MLASLAQSELGRAVCRHASCGPGDRRAQGGAHQHRQQDQGEAGSCEG